MSRLPRGLTEPVRGDWAMLGAPTQLAAAFDSAMTAGLPEPTRRWLMHAVAPGTPLRTSVELRMHGEIRLGSWRAFTAVQRVSAAEGFVWAATARLFGLPVIGFDRYTRGSGQMRWRLLDAVPVMSDQGVDVTRSAAGRHAGEILLATPAAALRPGVSWSVDDAGRAVAHVPVGADSHEVALTVAPGGALSGVVMRRWGKPGDAPFGDYAFGATLQEEVAFDGFTIPRRITAGWHYGTDRWPEGQFIRYTVDEARFA